MDNTNNMNNNNNNMTQHPFWAFVNELNRQHQATTDGTAPPQADPWASMYAAPSTNLPVRGHGLERHHPHPPPHHGHRGGAGGPPPPPPPAPPGEPRHGPHAPPPPHGRPGHDGPPPPPRDAPHGPHGPPSPPANEHDGVYPPPAGSRPGTPPTPPESHPEPSGRHGAGPHHPHPRHHHHRHYGPRGSHHRGGPPRHCGRGGRAHHGPGAAAPPDFGVLGEWLRPFLDPAAWSGLGGAYAQHARSPYAPAAEDGEDEDSEGVYTPETDVFFLPGRGWVIHCALPGARKGDVDVSFDTGRQKNCLRISAVVGRPEEVDSDMLEGLVQSGRRVGLYRATVQLDESRGRVEQEGMLARLEEGVLRVEVPVEEEEGWTEVRKVVVE